MNNPVSNILDIDFAIKTENLWRVYTSSAHQAVEALRGVSLSIPTGKLVLVKGRSGSGKTTLLNCLGGLDRPTSGNVRIFEREILTLNDNDLTQWRREQIGFIFQSFGLLPALSAFENVELELRIAGRSGKTGTQRALKCLDLVGLTHWTHHRPYELSGGQQQRVAIARALANRPRLILADEPTGELDSSNAHEILSLLRRIVNEDGVTLLVATHDPLLDKYADFSIHLKDGQLSE